MKLIDRFEIFLRARSVTLTSRQHELARDWCSRIECKAVYGLNLGQSTQVTVLLDAFLETLKPPPALGRLPASQERPADVRTLMRLRGKKKK